MANGTVLQERLRSALRYLELVDFEGVRAKQQVSRMLGEDFQAPPSIILLPYVFTVEGVTYQATITSEQRDVILDVAANGTTQEVLDKINQDIFGAHLFTGAIQALNSLIAALTNTVMPQISAVATEAKAKTATVSKPTDVTVGACVLNNVCVPNFPAPFCRNQGGQPIGSCQEVLPLAPPDPGATPA